MNVTAQKQNCQQLSKKIRFKTKIRKLRNFISDEVRTREFQQSSPQKKRTVRVKYPQPRKHCSRGSRRRKTEGRVMIYPAAHSTHSRRWDGMGRFNSSTSTSRGRGREQRQIGRSSTGPVTARHAWQVLHYAVSPLEHETALSILLNYLEQSDLPLVGKSRSIEADLVCSATNSHDGYCRARYDSVREYFGHRWIHT